MATPTSGSPRPGYPPSPCIRLCVLDDRNICTGCRRSLDEVVAWSTMTAAEQWAVVRRLGTRGESGGQ